MALIEIGDHRLSRGDIRDLLATDHPMVEQFRFDKQQEQRGTSLHFALIIVPRRGVRYLQQRDGAGRRIEPTWSRLSGRESVGQGNRSLWVESDEIVAENCTFFPNQEFNDLGIGSALYVSMERLYRHLGVRRVTLLAVDVGVYVWARQGFDFSEPGTLADQVGHLGAVLRQEEPDQAFERSAFGHSWDLANLEVPGSEPEGYRWGKYFMLRHADPWYGVKRLDEERHNAVAEASRRDTFARLPDKIDGAPPDLAVR